MPSRDNKQSSFRVTIRPNRGWEGFDLSNFWEYRDLVYFLAWRDIKVRYKQTVLGVMWVVVQPVLLMVIFSVFFGQMAKVPSAGLPYPIFILSGLLPWQLFANGIGDCGNSLIANQNLVTKVYFPRLVLPIAAFLPRLVDLFFALLVFLGMVLYFGPGLTWTIWTLPIFILLAATTCVAVGLWVSALNLRYRDVRQLVPLAIQTCFFLSPVAYPTSFVPEGWRALFGLNPMLAVLEGFRWSLFGRLEASGVTLVTSIAMTGLLLVGGICYFRRIERTFADLV
jgi:lipopolysaccharide transport system permease protein